MSTYAVVGEDGRRVFRGLFKDDAEQKAASLQATTGEQMTVQEELVASGIEQIEPPTTPRQRSRSRRAQGDGPDTAA